MISKAKPTVVLRDHWAAVSKNGREIHFDCRFSNVLEPVRLCMRWSRRPQRSRRERDGIGSDFVCAVLALGGGGGGGGGGGCFKPWSGCCSAPLPSLLLLLLRYRRNLPTSLRIPRRCSKVHGAHFHRLEALVLFCKAAYDIEASPAACRTRRRHRRLRLTDGRCRCRN